MANELQLSSSLNESLYGENKRSNGQCWYSDNATGNYPSHARQVIDAQIWWRAPSVRLAAGAFGLDDQKACLACRLVGISLSIDRREPVSAQRVGRLRQ